MCVINCNHWLSNQISDATQAASTMTAKFYRNTKYYFEGFTWGQFHYESQRGSCHLEVLEKNKILSRADHYQDSMSLLKQDSGKLALDVSFSNHSD
jgi:hypothetical protein